jgi:hypothetical protein
MMFIHGDILLIRRDRILGHCAAAALPRAPARLAVLPFAVALMSAHLSR